MIPDAASARYQLGETAVGGALPKPPAIPDHELLRCIGRGSYGEVWLARNVTRQYRAVKIVSRHTFDHDRPFEREFSGIQRCEPISRTHPGLVDVLHVGRNDERAYFYYVMELADNVVTGQDIQPDQYQSKTLQTEMRVRGRLSAAECVQMGVWIGQALEHLHKHGLVHRDVKPSNIVFVQGVAKLADVGLVAGLDSTRSFVGTEGYLAPEGAGTPSADLYALGKVLYEASTGQHRCDFPALPEDFRGFPDGDGLQELNEVQAKACASSPKDRYLSASAFLRDLVLLERGRSLRQRRVLRRRTSRAAAIVVVLVVVLGCFSVFYNLRQESATSPRPPAGENLDSAKVSSDRRAMTEHSRKLVREGIWLEDDFSGSAINTNLWEVSKPFGFSQCFQSDGRITLVRRGGLNTRASLPGPIEIEGRFRFMGLLDTFQIVLRSDLTLVPPPTFGERSGVIADFDQEASTVRLAVSGAQTLAVANFIIEVGKDIEFRITDDGETLRYYLNGNSEPILSASSPARTGGNIAIYNREIPGTKVEVDFLRITVLTNPHPPPSMERSSETTGTSHLAVIPGSGVGPIRQSPPTRRSLQL